MPISEIFAVLISDSWASANQLHSWRALLIFEPFAASKRNSWTSANRTLCRRYYPYLNVSQPENVISEDHQIDPLQDGTAHIWTFRNLKELFQSINKSTPFAESHSPYLTVFQPEYAIPENQQIDPVTGRHCPYLNVSQTENAISENQHYNPLEGWHCPYLTSRNRKRHSWASAISTTCRTTLPISERFVAWKRDSWDKAIQFPCNRAPSIHERFAAWKRNSWSSQVDPLAVRLSPLMNVSQPENAIPKYQLIAPVAGRHYTYLSVLLP